MEEGEPEKGEEFQKGLESEDGVELSCAWEGSGEGMSCCREWNGEGLGNAEGKELFL